MFCIYKQIILIPNNMFLSGTGNLIRQPIQHFTIRNVTYYMMDIKHFTSRIHIFVMVLIYQWNTQASHLRNEDFTKNQSHGLRVEVELFRGQERLHDCWNYNVSYLLGLNPNRQINIYFSYKIFTIFTNFITITLHYQLEFYYLNINL